MGVRAILPWVAIAPEPCVAGDTTLPAGTDSQDEPLARTITPKVDRSAGVSSTEETLTARRGCRKLYTLYLVREWLFAFLKARW